MRSLRSPTPGWSHGLARGTRPRCLWSRPPKAPLGGDGNELDAGHCRMMGFKRALHAPNWRLEPDGDRLASAALAGR
jgi:hypothetical protein